MSETTGRVDRRRLLALLATVGVGGTSFARTVWAIADEMGDLTAETLATAEQIAGLEFTDSERELMIDGVAELREAYRTLRGVPLENSVPPALLFDPSMVGVRPRSRPAIRRSSRPSLESLPTDADEIALLPITVLSELIRMRAISSEELTRLYLQRLERYDPQLRCVVTLTSDRAIAQARQADRDLARGVWRGPLHGIPWGAKDLLAVRGYPTTWGAAPFREQVIDEDASVVRRLDAAGAVLVAKLTLGALAWGDVWFDGMTRNPWNLEQGSSGSSAGPGAATAAGLVGFAVGSETWGSIVSPSDRCGVSGLRPTFGRVSRHGAMALSWSMDKLGPMCRSAEDCALVFESIHGSDPLDPTAVDEPFTWDAELDVRRLRVGYVQSAFDAEPEGEDDEELARAREVRALDSELLEVLRGLGVELVPIELPDLPISSLSFILSAEAAAAFDEFTRSGRDDQLVRQLEQAWPNVFRQARLIPAVEYVQANRVRTLAMREMRRILDGLDVYVCPSFGSDNLLLTNLTGHPAVVVPHGFTSDGTPASITFTGTLYGEEEALALAHRCQLATGYHLRHPDLSRS
jgi:Asp-tRNA(Asn)/Glu-tRNA(Gln) amidotransferase A subunit family amidase